MAFLDTAQSLRAKLHLSGVSTPLLVGVCCLIVVALGLAAFGLWNAFSADTFSVEEASVETDEASSADAADAEAPQPMVMVHVSGAVAAPGLFELPEGSRVNDAIAAAGGMSEVAAPDALNLARIVTDGEQIIVPTAEEQQAQQAAAPGAAGVGAGGKVNINTADAAQLDTLPGVGESTAEKIIADREANGPFATPEDLKRVSGIGERKYEELADLITVG